MNSVDFGYWIQSEREKREWSQSDLARFSGLHRAVISKIESGTKPMPETLTSLANAFKMSPISIFRIAGLLPPGTETEATLHDWEYLLSQLPKDEQDEVRQIALMKIEKRQRIEAAARSSQFKPKHQGG